MMNRHWLFIVGCLVIDSDMAPKLLVNMREIVGVCGGGLPE
jgi:hypothetical protein